METDLCVWRKPDALPVPNGRLFALLHFSRYAWAQLTSFLVLLLSGGAVSTDSGERYRCFDRGFFYGLGGLMGPIKPLAPLSTCLMGYLGPLMLLYVVVNYQASAAAVGCDGF